MSLAVQEIPNIERSAKKNLLKHSITLRCMAYPDKGSYVAECIDLNILVRRKTLLEATCSIEDAIKGYMLTVLDRPDAVAELAKDGRVKGLMPRMSPFSHRLRYHAYCLLAAIFCGNDRQFQLHDYSSNRFATC